MNFIKTKYPILLIVLSLLTMFTAMFLFQYTDKSLALSKNLGLIGISSTALSISIYLFQQSTYPKRNLIGIIGLVLILITSSCIVSGPCLLSSWNFLLAAILGYTLMAIEAKISSSDFLKNTILKWIFRSSYTFIIAMVLFKVSSPLLLNIGMALLAIVTILSILGMVKRNLQA